MRSPISVTLAEITMQRIENSSTMLCTVLEKIRWLRYSNNSCSEKWDIVTSFKYNIYNNIKITYEVEKHSTLAYLDIIINKNDNGFMNFEIYRKPTNT